MERTSPSSNFAALIGSVFVESASLYDMINREQRKQEYDDNANDLYKFTHRFTPFSYDYNLQ